MLILDAAAVGALLPMDECIDIMRNALVALARNDAVTPLRTVIRMSNGALAAMPAYDGTTETVGLKIVTVFPNNPAVGLPSHLGVVLLFRATDGVVSAILDAAAITAIRTAAVSALATRVLATEGADVLAIIGTGVQAETHIAAMLAVRPLRLIRVFGRDPGRTSAFISRLSRRHDCELVAAESAEHAVRGAHIVCTVTGSRTPV
ncbi:MAG: ornithine cyclodeaminase family protein, partial [Gemmatimonadaceae bacterium]